MRYLFAALFIVTAIGKLLDNRGFAEILKTYQSFPSRIMLPFALSISVAELILGYYLMRSEHLLFGAAVTLAIYAGYLVIAIITNVRGLRLPNRGCFGVFWGRPTTWQTVVEDTVLIGLSLEFFPLVSGQ